MKKWALSFLFVALLPVWLLAQAPVIYDISPSIVHQTATESIVISGNYFQPGPTVDMGAGITITSVTYINVNFVSVDVDVAFDAPLGFHDVILTNFDGLADTLVDGLEVLEDDMYPPDITVLFPTCVDTPTVSCPDSGIYISLSDEHGLDTTTLELVVDGTPYHIDDPELSVDFGGSDTLIIFRPSSPWSDGDMVVWSLTVCEDMLHNGIPSALTCRFIVDLSPPYVTGHTPPAGGTTDDLAPIVSFALEDEFSGVDTSSVIISVNGVHYPSSDASIHWRGDTLYWEALRAGVLFSDGDTVSVCVIYAQDNPDFCEPNAIEDSICWFFRIYVPPPEDINIVIHQINPANFPVITALCYVFDDEGRTIMYLDENNFTVHEDGLFEYPIIVQSLGGGGNADIVFVLDVTGSMSGRIHDILDQIADFADSLAHVAINFRLGLVTFGDTVYFPFGTDLTSDVSEYEDWLEHVPMVGGGDGPEVSLDGIADALDSLHWRMGAQRVIIMITDYRPHTAGDGTSFSDETVESVCDLLVATNTLCFTVTPDLPEFHGPGSVSDCSGGSWYLLGTPFSEILASLVESIRGGYYVSYTTHHPIADCTDRDVEIEARYLTLSDEDEMPYAAPCSPEAHIVAPLPEKITSRRYQQIIMDLGDFEGDIDESSIRFVVEGVEYNTVMPQLELSGGGETLMFTPSIPFVNEQYVECGLTRMYDSQGSPAIHGPVAWHFWVDLEGPRVSSEEPSDGEYLTPQPPTVNPQYYPEIAFDITDNLSGVDSTSIVVFIEDTWMADFIELSILSDGVDWDGTRFSFDPAEYGATFGDRDTVCVNVVRAGDSPDYGDPNPLEDAPYRFCFVIPDDDTIGPIISDFSPSNVPATVPFRITCHINDTSGIFDDNTDTTGYGVYLVYDSDGSVDDGSYNTVQMSPDPSDSTVFRTDELLPGQAQDANFVYRVCAYDDDTDNGDPADRTQSCADATINFGNIIGPVAEIVKPLPETWTTNEDESIVIRLYDDENGVDDATIRLRVRGTVYSVDGTRLVYDFADSLLTYYPQPGEYWTTGEEVYVSLIAAEDSIGNPMEDSLYWSFWVDLEGPFGSDNLPENGDTVSDHQQDVMLRIRDALRDVDISSLVINIYGTDYIYTSPGIIWDPSTHILTFVPEMASPEVTYENGDTVWVCLNQITDSEPDYGEPNDIREPYCWFFIPFVPPLSFCNALPNPFTPNGDGYNDVVEFTYPRQYLGRGQVSIYTIENRHIRDLPVGERFWDGTDASGNPLPRGVYLYTISMDDEVVCNGTVLLIR